MTWLSDDALDRLRATAGVPDLSGTRYRVVRRIGRGGMGAVYLAHDESLQRRVALKVLDRPDVSGHLAARLVREAHILARLEHPGIVPVHDVGTLPDGRFYYTMKLVRGDRLDHHVREGGTLQERLRLFVRICDAAAFAHAHGVLHRDLKPENVMVGPFGEVLVMDWGVAKILHDGGAPRDENHAASTVEAPVVSPREPAAPGSGTSAARDRTVPTGAVPARTEHGSVLGTPGYMAPEQARGEVDRLDRRADVYALGALLRFLVTGRSPRDTGAATASMPRPLAAICGKAMSAGPEERYSTADDLAADVARYLDGEPPLACPEGPFRKAGRLLARHRVAVLLLLTYVVVRAMVLVFLER